MLKKIINENKLKLKFCRISIKYKIQEFHFRKFLNF